MYDVSALEAQHNGLILGMAQLGVDYAHTLRQKEALERRMMTAQEDLQASFSRLQAAKPPGGEMK